MKNDGRLDKFIKKPEEALFSIIKYYSLCSLFFIIVILIFYYVDSALYNLEFCLSSGCISGFFYEFKNIIPIFEFLLKTLLSVVTIFGVLAALKNYLNTTHSARVNIHLTHLNTFKEYLQSEVNKEPRIDTKTVDILKWYNLAFPESRKGSLDIGSIYLKTVGDINKEIEISNKTSSGKLTKVFKYNEHQTRIIDKLSVLGIYVNRMPKKEFFEVEEEIFTLINKINKEICLLETQYFLFKRKYT